MDFKLLDIFFQIIVFLFAISVHESAHAWMANRCGDPTAKMLGRITMNPIKHIDPFGTVLLPAIGLLTHAGMFGWAKPTPVTTQNFRDPVRGDILTTLAGPVSNFMLVVLSVFALLVISNTSAHGQELVHNLAHGAITETRSPLMPVVWLLYTAVYLNVLLGIFNLIPVPPLDGSHVFRHLLPDTLRQIYDQVGFIGILLLLTVGSPLVRALVYPTLGLIDSLLLRV
jgi:Zn-dependent protease